MSAKTQYDDERQRRGATSHACRRGAAALAGGALLAAAAWACKELTPTPSSPPMLSPSGAVESATRPAPGNAEPGRQRTTQGQMLSHYDDTTRMRRALVAGKLVDYSAAAADLARDEWAPGSTPGSPAFIERVRVAAASAQAASSLMAASTTLSRLADACASCHIASEMRKVPLAPEEPSVIANPRMLAHAVASDRLWAGLVLPSDESWASGIELLVQFPALDAPSSEVSAAVEQLSELARRGQYANLDQRGPLFRDVMLTCSGCHERLGVVPADGVEEP